MSTVYQQPMAAYDGHAMHGYHRGLIKAAMPDASANHLYRQQLQQSHPTQQQPPMNWPPRDGLVPTQQQSGASRHSTRHSTPTNGTAVQNGAKDESSSRRGSDTLIYHSLQIPRRISPEGGNLADFAAQVRSMTAVDRILPTHANHIPDDLPVLVRISRRTQGSRNGSIDVSRGSSRSPTDTGQAARTISEMGLDGAVYNPGYTKCDLARPSLYIPAQNVDPTDQGPRW
jgi:hypothetical protein